MNKEVLIKTFKEFKLNPKKIFVASDFTKAGINKFRESHLRTLKSLGLIEELNTRYNWGKDYNIRKAVRGYRLI